MTVHGNIAFCSPTGKIHAEYRRLEFRIGDKFGRLNPPHFCVFSTEHDWSVRSLHRPGRNSARVRPSSARSCATMNISNLRQPLFRASNVFYRQSNGHNLFELRRFAASDSGSTTRPKKRKVRLPDTPFVLRRDVYRQEMRKSRKQFASEFERARKLQEAVVQERASALSLAKQARLDKKRYVTSRPFMLSRVYIALVHRCERANS